MVQKLPQILNREHISCIETSRNCWDTLSVCVSGLSGAGGWRRQHPSRHLGERVYDASAGEWIHPAITHQAETLQLSWYKIQTSFSFCALVTIVEVWDVLRCLVKSKVIDPWQQTGAGWHWSSWLSSNRAGCRFYASLIRQLSSRIHQIHYM